MNLADYPIGTTYICRDGSEIAIVGRTDLIEYPYRGSNGNVYNKEGSIVIGNMFSEDIVAVKEQNLTLPIQVGKKYIRRDGRVTTIKSGPDNCGRYYTDTPYDNSAYAKAYVYSNGFAFKSCSRNRSDIIADYVESVNSEVKQSEQSEQLKLNKSTQYQTIIKLASAVQEAGGYIGVLKNITLEDFINICDKNNIDITAKYK